MTDPVRRKEGFAKFAEVMQAAADEGIDAHITKGGTISLARSAPQWARARAEVEDARSEDESRDQVGLRAH